MEIEPGAISTSAVSCNDPLSGEIVLHPDFITGGDAPFHYDWDYLATPENDSPTGDGSPVITRLAAGTYSVTVTDDHGCQATALAVVEEVTPIAVSFLVDTVLLCELTGGVEIISVTGPPGIRVYNWDLASTPFDDDYGPGQFSLGLPPYLNDSEDQVETFVKGIYYLTLTIKPDTLNPLLDCVYRDTFYVYDADDLHLCPGEDIDLSAGEDDLSNTYQWQIDSTGSYQNLTTGIHFSKVTAPILSIQSPPSSWYNHKLRCIISDGFDTDTSQVYTLKFRNCWRGGVIWEQGVNWECTSPPDPYTDAYMVPHNNATSFVTNGGTCRSMTVTPGFKVEILSGKVLTITGWNEE